MNWIPQFRRLAIYLRDGVACCYCGDTIERGAKLTLDHIIPYADGGSNEPTNLVTACFKCNSSRGKRSVAVFVKAVAAYINHDIKPRSIIRHIEKTRVKPLHIERAKELINQRGSCFKVLHNVD